MSRFIITADTTMDLPMEMIHKYDIVIIFIYFILIASDYLLS